MAEMVVSAAVELDLQQTPTLVVEAASELAGEAAVLVETAVRALVVVDPSIAIAALEVTHSSLLNSWSFEHGTLPTH